MRIFSNGPFAAIFWGGLLAGVLDLTQAFIGFSLMGSTPFRILQRIAAGIFGTHSRHMGSASAAIGLTCHFTVAFGAATVYYFASRKLRLLVERPVLCGLFYGELVFLFMYFVVIPLSAIGHPQYNIATYITGPHRTSAFGWIADRSLRSPLLQLKRIYPSQVVATKAGRNFVATLPEPGTANQKDSADRISRPVLLLLHVHNVRRHRHDVRDAVKNCLPDLRLEHRRN